tara:strand:+ start:658 stop:2247 length:1590 start_codon:yes stop_codon:yes gene_type:complete
MVFSGTVGSEYMKLGQLSPTKKAEFIDFAATDFVSLRKSLLQYVKAVYPTEFNNFTESDLGIMFLELVAYMGSVMSYKADMLAHENYLSTATKRDSVQKLLKLIGVNMRGPLSAGANAELELTTTVGTNTLVLGTNERTIGVVSPEDGFPLTYTLYKVTNGNLDEANTAGSITLTKSMSKANAGLLWDNLALLEGTLVGESGSFFGTETIKRIQLTQSPVIDGSVEVVVNSSNPDVSGAFTQVDNLYFASGAGDRVFQVDYDDDFNATISFGDGAVGVNPEDSATYNVLYRVGGGSRGNLPPHVINVARSFNDSAGNVYDGGIKNSSMATGGQDAETVEHAKRYGPLVFRRQDRLVTLQDYNSFCNSFTAKNGTIGKANTVTRQAYSAANIIDVFVLERATQNQLQQASSAFKLELLAAINEKKMLTDEVIISDGLIRTLDLVITIRVKKELAAREEAIKTKVKNKIVEFFDSVNMEFGQSFVSGKLNRAIFDLPEVQWSTVDNIPSNIHIEQNEILQLNNLALQVEHI